MGLPELSNVCSTHHGDPSCATERQDAAVGAANPACQRQDSSEGRPTPSGQALGHWHGKGKHVPTVWSHYQQQGRDHWDQQIGPEEIGERRGDASLQPEVGGTHRTGQIDEAKRLLEKAYLEVQKAQSKVIEAACRLGEEMEEMAKIRSLMEANLQSADR